MKGIRFYLEYRNPEDKRKATRRKLGNHEGTVIALFLDTWQPNGVDNTADCMAGIYKHPDSPVVGTSVSEGYLRDRCKHISEAQAREIHPALFERLDNE